MLQIGVNGEPLYLKTFSSIAAWIRPGEKIHQRVTGSAFTALGTHGHQIGIRLASDGHQRVKSSVLTVPGTDGHQRGISKLCALCSQLWVQTDIRLASASYGL